MTQGLASTRAVVLVRGRRAGVVRRRAASPRAVLAKDADDDAARSTRPSFVVSRRGACAAVALAATSALPARASSEDISRAYDGYAATYDDLDGGAFAADTLGLDATRRDLLARASGDVLELGVGTGLNLPGYDTAKLASLTAVDISGGMLALARQRAETLNLRVIPDDASGDDASTSPSPSQSPSPSPSPGPPARFMLADAESLPFPDASFDCVVDTFSLCVIEHPEAALREVRRVLRPGGRALLVEHTRSSVAPLLGAYQDLVAAPVKAMSKGCAWNQDVLAMAEAAGLRVVRAEPSLAGLLTTVEATPA